MSRTTPPRSKSSALVGVVSKVSASSTRRLSHGCPSRSGVRLHASVVQGHILTGDHPCYASTGPPNWLREDGGQTFLGRRIRCSPGVFPDTYRSYLDVGWASY